MTTDIHDGEAAAAGTILAHRRKRRRRRSSGSHRSRVDRLVQAEWVVAAAAAAMAVFFYLVFLIHAGGLWRDEATVVTIASAPSINVLWGLAHFESVPVPWLIALRAWTSAGLATDMTIRVFGLLSGLALPAAVWFAVRRLTRAAPLASMALIAVNPEIVRWSATVRPWGLGAALAIVAMVLMREASVALTRRRILFAAIAALLAVQFQYQNVVFVASAAGAAASVALVRRRTKEALVPIAIAAVAILSLWPCAGLLHAAGEWRTLMQVPVTFGDLGGRIWDMGLASGTVVVTCAIGLVGMGLLSAVQWAMSPDADSTNRPRRGVANYAAAAFVIAALAVVLVQNAASLQPAPWQFVGLLSFVAVCAEVAVASAVQARVARIALVVLAAVVLLSGSLPAWAALHERQTNIDVIAARVTAEADRADLVVVNPWELATSFRRYYTGAAPVLTVPPIEDHRVPRFDLLRAQMMNPDPLGPVFARIQQALESGQQVWIVGGLDVPAVGEQAARLPAPPLPDTGWSAAPYEHAWSLATGEFLQAHVVDFRERPVGVSGGVSETASLAVLKGWK